MNLEDLRKDLQQMNTCFANEYDLKEHRRGAAELQAIVEAEIKDQEQIHNSIRSDENRQNVNL